MLRRLNHMSLSGSNSRKKLSLLPGDFVNLGDALLSLAAARRIARDNQVTLLPYRLPDTEVVKEFEQEGFSIIGIRDSPWLALRACFGSSIWIGGGHAIRNHVSIGWLLFAFIVSRLAKALQASGRDVRFIGTGASAITSPWRRWFFGQILQCCDRVCVRDSQSAESLRADFPCIAKKVVITADLAFLKGCVDLHSSSLDECSCLVSPGIDGLEGRKEDIADIVNVLRELFQLHRLNRVILVPHDLRRNFGLAFCEELGVSIRATLPVTVEVISHSGVKRGLLAPYCRARWILTGRLHGLIIGAMLLRSVVYTPGSASKLQPFAELFEYKAAASKAVSGRFEVSSAVRPAVLRQEAAAELNFAA